jgi:hypothetical protein
VLHPDPEAQARCRRLEEGHGSGAEQRSCQDPARGYAEAREEDRVRESVSHIGLDMTGLLLTKDMTRPLKWVKNRALWTGVSR